MIDRTGAGAGDANPRTTHLSIPVWEDFVVSRSQKQSREVKSSSHAQSVVVCCSSRGRQLQPHALFPCGLSKTRLSCLNIMFPSLAAARSISVVHFKHDEGNPSRTTFRKRPDSWILRQSRIAAYLCAKYLSTVTERDGASKNSCVHKTAIRFHTYNGRAYQMYESRETWRKTLHALDHLMSQQ